jgi:hypothetical protein
MPGSLAPDLVSGRRLPRGLGDLWLCLRLLCFAAAVPLLMRLQLPRLRALLAPRGTRPPEDRGRAENTRRYLQALLRRCRPLLRRSCLTEGLTYYYFLNRAGMNLDLCFGGGWVKGRFEAHCWLEKDGAPYLESRDPRALFVEMHRFPGWS